VRAVPVDEARSPVRCGRTPEGRAACRTAALGLLRVLGAPTSAAACRRLAAQPQRALALLGIALDN
jgi:hypothetical protein